MVDSAKGMSSASFTISESDMKRLQDALNHTYTQQVRQDRSAAFGKKDVSDAVTRKEPLNSAQICHLLGENIMNSLVATVEKVEIELFYQELRANHEPIKVIGDKK